MSVLNLSIFFVLVVSALSIYFGILISRYDRFEYITVYKNATDQEREKFDIRGLADHVGNGLITIGILTIISVVMFYLEYMTLSVIFIFLSIFIAAIVIIGSYKFIYNDSAIRYAFLYKILPRKRYEALKRSTKEWLMVCHTCGHKSDYWENGGIRSGVGEPSQLQYCKKCEAFRMHKIRKKTELEKREIR